jgi:hypothetical protein
VSSATPIGICCKEIVYLPNHLRGSVFVGGFFLRNAWIKVTANFRCLGAPPRRTSNNLM